MSRSVHTSSPSELDEVLFPFVAPRTASRHSLTLGVADELVRHFLTERVPYSLKKQPNPRSTSPPMRRLDWRVPLPSGPGRQNWASADKGFMRKPTCERRRGHSRVRLLACREPAKAHVVVLGRPAVPANDNDPIPTLKAIAKSSEAIKLRLTFAQVDDEVALAELSRILKRMAARRGEG